MVSEGSTVCIEEITRCPVSAAPMAALGCLVVGDVGDDDDVRVLANRPVDRFGEVGSVDPDLALGDDGQLVRVEDLDRIFDGDDRDRAGAVDVVDDRRHRRALARARRTGDEDQSLFLVGEATDHRRQAEVLKAG